MSNVRIDIASEFNDKGFKKAAAATSSLEKSADRLGRKLAAAFSAYKIAAYAKASVKAFAEDQKAAAVLAKTLENVNQGFANEQVASYIAKTEALYGVLDDKLRPAFSKLVVATHDAAMSQKLLQTALDVSAGTGKDLESVTAALSKAYLGNTSALSRLGVGLSAADLKTKSFNDIINILNQNFSGAAATAADTYQGKLDKLNVAFKNMQETIGKGLIDAFNNLDSSAGFQGVIDSMSKLADKIANVIVGAGQLVNMLKSIPGIGVLGNLLSDSLSRGLLGQLERLGSKTRVSKSQSSVVTNFLSDMTRIAAATAKSNDNAKKLLTTTKALTKEQKDQLALKKAGLEVDKALGIFNMENIELQAASMSKQTAEDYARIKLKQDIIKLQDAINSGDAAAATKLAAIVEDDLKRVQAYQAINLAIGVQTGLISNVAAVASLIPTDLNLINLDNLKSAIGYINTIIASLANVSGKTATGGAGGSSSVVSGARMTHNVPSLADTAMENYVAALDVMKKNADALAPIVNSGFFDLYYNAQESLGAPINPYQLTDAQARALNGNFTITVNNNTGGLADVIMSTTQDQSANGVSTRITRNTGGLAW